MATRIFITSDLHFNHRNIIDYCNRPFTSVDDMNATLIKNWNNTVAKEDIVIVIGDFGFGKRDYLAQILSQLNGHKRLIMGNHDNYKPAFYASIGFEWVSPFPVIWQDKYILSHCPLDIVPEGYINLYGHVHTDPTIETYAPQKICVCCDRFDLTPQRFENLLENYKHAKVKGDRRIV